jgi:hypothetical protein
MLPLDIFIKSQPIKKGLRCLRRRAFMVTANVPLGWYGWSITHSGDRDAACMDSRISQADRKNIWQCPFALAAYLPIRAKNVPQGLQ